MALVVDPYRTAVSVGGDLADRAAALPCVLLLRVEAADVLEDASWRGLVALSGCVRTDFQLPCSSFSLRHFHGERPLHSEVSVAAAHDVLACSAVHDLVWGACILLNLHLRTVSVLDVSPVATGALLMRGLRVSSTLIGRPQRGSPP